MIRESDLCSWNSWMFWSFCTLHLHFRQRANLFPLHSQETPVPTRVSSGHRGLDIALSNPSNIIQQWSSVVSKLLIANTPWSKTSHDSCDFGVAWYAKFLFQYSNCPPLNRPIARIALGPALNLGWQWDRLECLQTHLCIMVCATGKLHLHCSFSIPLGPLHQSNPNDIQGTDPYAWQRGSWRSGWWRSLEMWGSDLRLWDALRESGTSLAFGFLRQVTDMSDKEMWTKLF